MRLEVCIAAVLANPGAQLGASTYVVFFADVTLAAAAGLVIFDSLPFELRRVVVVAGGALEGVFALALVEGNEVAQGARTDLELFSNGLVAASARQVSVDGVKALLIGQFALSHNGFLLIV